MPDDKSKDYAIVIGIKAYVGLRPLNSAVEDAVKFAEWLRRPDGGGLTGNGQVIPILGETFYPEWLKAEPNADTIKSKIYELGINRGKKIGRRLYIYFSGHGFTDNADEIAMAMANASLNYLDNSISLNSFFNLFRQVGYFEQIIFILDCCREQTKYNFTPQSVANVQQMKSLFDAITDLANGGNLPNATGAAAAEIPKVRDLFVFATGYGEQSYAPTDKDIGERRGLLTKALLEGLEGQAALTDGSITVPSLRAFIQKRVKELAVDHKVTQEAQIRDENSEGILIKEPGSLPPPSQINVKINIQKTVKGSLILYDRDKSEVFDVQQSGFVWNIPLEKRIAPPYFLESTNPVSYEKLDLSNATVGEEYVFSFPQSK
ncbi:MAG: caspase family protein [Pyrinomonadaceae bacterium]|nr:caspase family protein [Pyrinomonadaceae bacterium]